VEWVQEDDVGLGEHAGAYGGEEASPLLEPPCHPDPDRAVVVLGRALGDRVDLRPAEQVIGGRRLESRPSRIV